MKTRSVMGLILFALLGGRTATAQTQEVGSVVQLVRQSQEAAAATNLDQALSLAIEATRQDPGYAEGWKQLGVVHNRRRELPEAMAAFKTALDLKPDDGSVWQDYGWALWSRGDLDKAIEALVKAVGLGIPNKDQVSLQVVARLAEEGKRDRAIQLYETWNPGAQMLVPAIQLFESGRYQAAAPLLNAAWTRHEQPEVSGLFLAYTRALAGRCMGATNYLGPFLKSLGSTTEPKRVDMLLEILRVCPEALDLNVVIPQVEMAVTDRERYSGALTDILEKAADAARIRPVPERALGYYERVLERDPDRLCWIYAWDLARQLKGEDEADRLLKAILQRSGSPAVQEGIQGWLDENRQAYDKAAQAYELSLDRAPNQPVLRQHLFICYLRLNKLDKAQEVAEWFEQQVQQGDGTLRSYLAEMWTSLGAPEKALEMWQVLHLSSPDLPYYGVQSAVILSQMCRAEEALAVLQAMVPLATSPTVYETLADIETSLGRPERAAEWARKGIDANPSRNLYRYWMESDEFMDAVSTNTLNSAKLFLEGDPGNVPVSLLAGRALWTLGLTNEAQRHFEGLLERNPEFIASLIFLKDAASAEHRFADAVAYMRTAAAQRPWDIEIWRRYAIALAEHEKYRSSLRILRRLARHEPGKAVAVLLYRDIGNCPYPGQNNPNQIIEHLSALSEAGYEFILPGQLAVETDAPRVMIVIEDAGERAVERIDAALKRLNARAVYSANAGILGRTIPLKPDLARLRKLHGTGRWFLASSGPAENQRRVVAPDNKLGNPLTHRISIAGQPEDWASFSNRVNVALKGAANMLSDTRPRVLIYPGGDYGQSSLDATSPELAVLGQAVSNHFDLAFFFDDDGFATPGFDPARVPARVVPPSWRASNVLAHVKQANPLLRAELDLAKVLYWSRQHEQANSWFRKLDREGAEPFDVHFNWGGNAYQQGDNPTAVKKLEKAVELDPQSLKASNALQRARDRRRPKAEVAYSGWDDNEDRAYRKLSVSADLFALNALQAGLLANRNRWEKTGMGSEEGTRWGVDALWYAYQEIWLRGQLWRLSMDDLPDHTGGSASLHVPNTLLSGFVELGYNREEIETLEAIRAEIYADIYSARTYSRLFDQFDLYANLYRTDRTDDNQTTMLEGRLVWRLKEWPFVGAGYRFRFGDSDFDPPEYWAPQRLEQHQLYASWRGVYRRLNYQFSGEAGYAREEDTDWRFVWGGRARADLTVWRRLGLFGEANYFEGPVYNRTTLSAGANVRF